MTFLDQYEGVIRFAVFAGVFVLMAVLEAVFPRKDRALPRAQRWLTNGGFVVIDTLALRLVLPVLAVGMAEIAARNGWGLFNSLALPFWLEVALAFVILDLLIYAQHVATHKIPVLWRLHKVHHADRDIDATTGVRFHPVEIVLSMTYKLLCVVILGAPALAVFLFEVVLNAAALFNHANVRLPSGVDRIARRVIVTPDMHRVHHSVHRQETDSNYGFFLSIWDRMFRTYIAEPRDGHDAMTIGLSGYQDDKPARLLWSLWLPFRRVPADAAGEGLSGRAD